MREKGGSNPGKSSLNLEPKSINFRPPFGAHFELVLELILESFSALLEVRASIASRQAQNRKTIDLLSKINGFEGSELSEGVQNRPKIAPGALFFEVPILTSILARK